MILEEGVSAAALGGSQLVVFAPLSPVRSCEKTESADVRLEGRILLTGARSVEREGHLAIADGAEVGELLLGSLVRLGDKDEKTGDNLEGTRVASESGDLGTILRDLVERQGRVSLAVAPSAQEGLVLRDNQ